jgi:thiol-disulfide isomerase/thioredoxin
MSLRKALALAALTLSCTASWALEMQPFSQQTFDKLAQQGKPVVVDVTASWCPLCKKQAAALAQLGQQAAYKEVTVLTVDFDSEKPVN